MMKRPKSIFAFLILTLLIYSVSCFTVFAEEYFSSDGESMEIEEVFSSEIFSTIEDEDTDFEPAETTESGISSDETIIFVSEPSDLSGMTSGADTGTDTGFHSEVTSESLFSSEETQFTPDDENEYNPKEEYSGYIVNPLWADIVTEEDLKRMVEELPAEDITAPVGSLNVVYYDNPHDCMNVVQNALLNHRGYVSFGYHCEDDDYPDPTDFTHELIWGACLEHNGNPKMGDTLRGNMAGAYWVRVADKEKSNGVNYTYVLRFIWFTTNAQEKELDTAVARVITLLNETGASSDFEKISFLYNYITEHVEYDYYNLGNKKEMIHFTAYSALVNGRAVCKGIALLVYRLMLEAGIDCRFIEGNHTEESPEGHAWNIVRLGDVYYNIDATWDEARIPAQYRYFLRCDENFYSHIRDEYYLTEDFYKRFPMSPTDYTIPDAVMIEKDGLRYRVSFGEAKVTGYDENHPPVSLTIPSTVNGYPVTGISGDAFWGCDTLQQVTFPATLKEFDSGSFNKGGSRNGSFAECTNLKEIHFADEGSSLSRIGDLAFFNCTGIKEFNLPAGLKEIGRWSFAGCSAINKVSIPGSVEVIGDGAFRDMNGDAFVYGLYTTITIGDPNERTFGDKQQTTIHGYSFSLAAQYAREAGYEFQLLDWETHTHEWGDPVVMRVASCRNSGELRYTCTVCGSQKYEDIPQKEHTYSDWVTIKEPTCRKKGVEERYCVLCEHMEERRTEKAKHTYGSWKTVRKATVLKTGKRSRSCSICGYTQTKTVSKLSPTWKLSAEKITLKKGRSSSKQMITGFARGDYVKSWKNSKSSVVTIKGTKKGKVTFTAKKKGTGKITATLASGVKIRFTVTVK